MGTAFYKMTGSGNDFVMLDGRAQGPGDWPVARIVSTCARRTGIGADGLVILVPEGPATVRMHFFNADGSRAAMCGNAALCSAVLSHELGLAPAELTLVADAGPVACRVLGQATAEIGLPPVKRLDAVPAIDLIAGERAAWLTTVGVPHLVVLVDDVDQVDINGRGRELRFHPAVGAAGANANFISAPRTPGGPWLIRTFERGVEGETLACGTGTVAAALMLHQLGVDDLPAVFRSRGGNVLGVTAVAGPQGYADVRLEGEGRIVFRGDLP